MRSLFAVAFVLLGLGVSAPPPTASISLAPYGFDAGKATSLHSVLFVSDDTLLVKLAVTHWEQHGSTVQAHGYDFGPKWLFFDIGSKRLLSQQEGPSGAPTWRLAGDRIAVLGNGGLLVYSKSGKWLAQYKGERYDYFMLDRVSPDGNTVFLYTKQSGQVHDIYLDAQSLQEMAQRPVEPKYTWQPPKDCGHLQRVPSGRGYCSNEVWGPTGNKFLDWFDMRHEPPPDRIDVQAFDESGRELLHLRWKPTPEDGYGWSEHHVTMSPDGKWLAVLRGGNVDLYSLP